MTQIKAKCQRCGKDLIPATKVSMGDEIEIRLIPCECMFRGDAHEESLRNAYWDGYTDHQAETENRTYTLGVLSRQK